jgi:hypothetical protein
MNFMGFTLPPSHFISVNRKEKAIGTKVKTMKPIKLGAIKL